MDGEGGENSSVKFLYHIASIAFRELSNLIVFIWYNIHLSIFTLLDKQTNGNELLIPFKLSQGTYSRIVK